MNIQLAYALFKKEKAGKLKIEIYAEVENMGFEKRVRVKNPDSGVIYCDAVYTGFTGSNQECWFAMFELDEREIPPGLPFILEYLVGSDIYYDNNAGSNYFIQPDMPEILIQSGRIFLIDARIEGSQFTGKIGIKSNSDISSVKVFYTIDKWQSISETPAQLSHAIPQPYGTSVFSFSVKVKDIKKADLLHFYLSCIIDGETYWGNNFSRDYMLKVKA